MGDKDLPLFQPDFNGCLKPESRPERLSGKAGEACHRRGISRSQFYEHKRRFQTHGLEGLKDLPPVHNGHPQTTPEEVVEQILELSLKNPMWSCRRLASQLKLQGVSVSSPTIQKILIKQGKRPIDTVMEFVKKCA